MSTDGLHKALIVSDQPINLVNVIDDEGGRWFRVLCCIVESGAWARMSEPACRVYMVLAKHCGRGRWLAWPSIATIVRLSGVSQRRVYYALAELSREGLLRRRTGGGGRQSSTYELLDVPATPSLPFPPVREKSALPPAAPHPCRQRQPTPAASGTQN